MKVKQNTRKQSPGVFLISIYLLGAIMMTMLATSSQVAADATIARKQLDPLPFDRILPYEEMTALLQDWARVRPGLVEMESIGQTPQGRDLWFLTLTNKATGPASEKPAVVVDGNMHSVEWVGGVAALNFVWRLVRDYGLDDAVTRLLDTRAVYVLPRFSPDGVESTLKDGKIVRSVVRDGTALEGDNSVLHMQDMDGDGRIVFMRYRDPNGPWKIHPEEPRLLVARTPEDAGGEYWRLAPEGRISGYDGVTFTAANALQGMDFGALFPDDRENPPQDDEEKPDWGPLPEVDAYVRAIEQRPNISAHVTCHTFGGVFLTPPVNADEQIPFADTLIYRTLGNKGAKLTGYPSITYLSLANGLPPSGRHISTAMGWLYHIRGVFSFITEFWNPLSAAGIELDGPMSSWLGGHHPVEDELKLLRWSDEELGGQGFVPWHAYEHPQLGPVEVGGWDKIRYWYNAPFDRLQQEVSPHADWLIQLAMSTPLVQVREFSATPEAAGQWRLRLVVENAGWLPTYVSRKALERGIIADISAELALPAGARLLEGEAKVSMGQLEGRNEQRSTAIWWGYDPGTPDRTFVEWLVEAASGSELSVSVAHQRAGIARAALVLEN